ncbi:MAG: DUF4402 domain-containing protein [Lentimicrobium sp.]|jgi:hypothetical protein|nr:DUF4402 domain-containing protein [Lentimicrobium sp.]MDY0101787.1 DUF4402 domain-containing protein [Lentimicrobium sp.]
MKKVTIILTGVILMSIASLNVNAQVSATADAKATIVTTIGIVKDVNLNFGNLAVTSLAGAVELAPSLSATRTKSGGVTLPVITGSPTAAKFDVSGQENYTYSITLPASINLTGAGDDMVVDSFTTDKALNKSTLDASGDDSFFVGATIHVNALQAAGEYTNTSDLTVTVNYN